MHSLCSCFHFDTFVSDISADERHSVRDSSDNKPSSLRDALVQPFRQERIFDCDDARDGSASLPLRPPHTGNTVYAQVIVTDFAAKFESFLYAWQFALIHQDGDELDFFNERFLVRHNTVLGAWRVSLPSVWLYWRYISRIKRGVARYAVRPVFRGEQIPWALVEFSHFVKGR